MTDVFAHLRDALATLPSAPGIYRYFDKDDRLLYIGKAKNLRNRVRSYFHREADSIKTRALVLRVQRLEITVTHSELEALLLEQTLIKAHRPPFNITFRDDKSYPWIWVTQHAYPRMVFYRGGRQQKGRFLGPFPSSLAVRESLEMVQKLFQVRPCEDAEFGHRSRPCLQHQIGRCSAPCVGLINTEDYAEDMRLAMLFLEGRSEQVDAVLVQRMQQAADTEQFEKAAFFRDRVQALRLVQSRQCVVAERGIDLDAVALMQKPGGCCLSVVTVRDGRVLGSQQFFPKQVLELNPEEQLQTFVEQYYFQRVQDQTLPREIVLDRPLPDAEIIALGLSQASGRKIELRAGHFRQPRQGWLALAVTNATQSLAAHLAHRETLRERFEALSLLLNAPVARIECFDISHTGGEQTVASCVVFDSDGARKQDYRRFNIEGITPGDDYAAMHQAVGRRFQRHAEEQSWPDLLLIDGGKGQLSALRDVLADLPASVLVAGIAKGEDRKAGLEILHVAGREVALAHDSPATHLLQQVRDEAHRFAITGHRQRREKKRGESVLERLPGIGAAKRRALLNHFGGLQGLQAAVQQDIARVPGIGEKLAALVYDALH